MLWVQNSHAAPIPAGGGAARPHGRGAAGGAGPRRCRASPRVALDVAELLPGAALAGADRTARRAGMWCGRATRWCATGRTRIAHVNVERADLAPDPNIPSLPAPLGRGYLLPLPVLPRTRFRTLIQPTPMATTQDTLPLRLDVFDPQGARVAAHFLGCLPRDHAVAVDLDDLLPAGALDDGGHAELVYDFRDGGSADGWLHALVRAEDRAQRPRRRKQLRRAYLQPADDLSRRAAILRRPAAGPVHAAVPASWARPGGAVSPLLIYPASGDVARRVGHRAAAA